MLREELEEREEKTLAPYAMKSRSTKGRAHPEPEHPYRTAFQRDRDRIIHSTAFRRLEYKTQVFVNHEGDHYRTRLTHTIEVTQIARTIARALNLNEDLTETIALVHDVGHTPFGHSGEEALHNLMKDFGGFEHNAQGARVVELLERRYPDFPGLNLSWEIRESLRKHQTTYDQPLNDQTYHPEWQPLLEAQVVDAADVIAYDNHDLEDGIRAHLITESDAKQVELWKTTYEEVCKRFNKADQNLIRSQTIIALINLEVTDLIQTSLNNLKEKKIKSIDEVRATGERLVRFSDDPPGPKDGRPIGPGKASEAGMSARRKKLQDFLAESVYYHYRVARMTKKARYFVEELFKAYVAEPRQLAPYYQKWAEKVGLERSVCDYIAGMTDRYLQEEYKKLFYPFEKM